MHKKGQVIIEYCLIFTVAILMILATWKKISQTLPGSLEPGMQQAVNCMASTDGACR